MFTPRIGSAPHVNPGALTVFLVTESDLLSSIFEDAARKTP